MASENLLYEIGMDLSVTVALKEKAIICVAKDLAIAQKIAEAIKTSEKSKSVSQSEEYPIVDYNTNLLNFVKRDVEGLWTNKIKEDSFLFVVASENGNCEYGRGNTKYNAFKDCTKNQEENNIVGVCELYAEGEEVVWDGSVWDDSVKAVP